MYFFDCNAFFGRPAIRPLMPVPTAEMLLAEMDRAGIERALAWHIAQHDASPQAGNRLLALRHAKIPEEAKQAIAAGNLERILAEEEL